MDVSMHDLADRHHRGEAVRPKLSKGRRDKHGKVRICRRAVVSVSGGVSAYLGRSRRPNQRNTAPTALVTQDKSQLL